MRNIIQTLVICIGVLMPASAIGAVTDNDFVARLMKQVNAHPSAYPASDYKQITVSPTMMQSVIEMLTSTKMTETVGNNGDMEIVSKLLRNVRSLRIFIASDNINSYQLLADKVIRENRKIYTKFKLHEKAGDPKTKARVWTRQAGDRVVEIIAILDSDDKTPELRILNLTGEFSNDFINLLVKMPS